MRNLAIKQFLRDSDVRIVPHNNEHTCF